ncbi:MAG: hypothetical protein LBJ45_01545 [Holosporaceae bacterium]|jgi:hypothetical protein|nr:hypothetical protein [Holosporaceae bacterium]
MNPILNKNNFKGTLEKHKILCHPSGRRRVYKKNIFFLLVITIKKGFALFFKKSGYSGYIPRFLAFLGGYRDGYTFVTVVTNHFDAFSQAFLRRNFSENPQSFRGSSLPP